MLGSKVSPRSKVFQRAKCSSAEISILLIRKHTAIPNRELQGFYREIWVQGNSNYMLWQCTGFAGSIFVVKKGIPCIYYWISFGFITLTFVQSLNEFPCKISLSQGKACNGEMETNVMLTLLFYVAITGKIM